MEDTKKSMIKVVVYAMIIVAVLSVAIYIVYDLNGKSLDLSDREVRIIITDSMAGEPQEQYEIKTIPVNSIVMIQRLGTEDLSSLKVGDVLSFNNSNGMLINHRIIEIKNSSFVTHGDNTHATENVTYDMVHGKVVGANPWLGQGIMFVKDNLVYILIALVFVFAAATAIRWILSWEVDG